jgi:arylsulfatase A-like enzyme
LNNTGFRLVHVAARTTRHKYINYRELQGMDELYDLDNDPYEETNLIDRPDARATLRQMQAELRQLIEQTQYVTPAPAATAP